MLYMGYVIVKTLLTQCSYIYILWHFYLGHLAAISKCMPNTLYEWLH